MRTLLLTPWMAPHKIISWERAVVLVVLGKVDVLEEYDEEIRSRVARAADAGRGPPEEGGARRPSTPCASAASTSTRVTASAASTAARRRTMRDLNYDHVVPRVSRRQDGLGEHRDLLLRVQRPQGEPYPGGGGHEASQEAVQAVQPPRHAGAFASTAPRCPRSGCRIAAGSAPSAWRESAAA